MAHGTNLLESEVWLDHDEIQQYSQEVEQNAVEYLADMYASAFGNDTGLFDPRDNYDYDHGDKHMALDEIKITQEKRR